jgi:hypothetical protein
MGLTYPLTEPKGSSRSWLHEALYEKKQGAIHTGTESLNED